MFIKHYGNNTFKDGEIGYWHFYYLSKQIPALEASDVFVVMEGNGLAMGADHPTSKKRLRQLQTFATYGIKL